jgi:hypothetical protein
MLIHIGTQHITGYINSKNREMLSHTKLIFNEVLLLNLSVIYNKSINISI